MTGARGSGRKQAHHTVTGACLPVPSAGSLHSRVATLAPSWRPQALHCSRVGAPVEYFRPTRERSIVKALLVEKSHKRTWQENLSAFWKCLLTPWGAGTLLGPSRDYPMARQEVWSRAPFPIGHLSTRTVRWTLFGTQLVYAKCSLEKQWMRGHLLGRSSIISLGSLSLSCSLCPRIAHTWSSSVSSLANVKEVLYSGPLNRFWDRDIERSSESLCWEHWWACKLGSSS